MSTKKSVDLKKKKKINNVKIENVTSTKENVSEKKKKKTANPKLKQPKQKTPDAPKKEKQSGEKLKSFSKGEYAMENLALSSIRLEKGFNPRTSLGDIETLKTSVREHGIQQSLVVRPSKKHTGAYDLVVGHRRYTVATLLKLKSVPVVIRTDLEKDSDALAFAVSENAEDSRTNLSPVDQASAFKKIQEAEPKLSVNIIGKRCGCSGQHVRRMLRLLEAPKAVRERLDKGLIKSGAASAITEMNPEIQEKVIERIETGMTEAEVRRLGNKVAQEVSAPAKANKSRNKKSDNVSRMAVIRTRSEMRELSDDLLGKMLDADAKKKSSVQYKYALAVVYFFFGDIDDVDVDSKAFKASFEKHMSEVHIEDTVE